MVVLEVTFVTVAAVVSMTSALFAPREFVAPGVASVRTALFPATSLMVPAFSVSAAVDK